MQTPASSLTVDLDSISCPNFPGCWVADYDQSAMFACKTSLAVQYGIRKFSEYPVQFGAPVRPDVFLDFHGLSSLNASLAPAPEVGSRIRGTGLFTSSRGVRFSNNPSLSFVLESISLEPIRERRDKMFASCFSLLERAAPACIDIFRRGQSGDRLDFDRFSSLFCPKDQQELNAYIRQGCILGFNRAAYLRPQHKLPIIPTLYTIDLHPDNRFYGVFTVPELAERMTQSTDPENCAAWVSLAVTHPFGTLNTLTSLRNGEPMLYLEDFAGREETAEKVFSAAKKLGTFKATFVVVTQGVENYTPDITLPDYCYAAVKGQKEWGSKPLLSVLSDPINRGFMPIKRAADELRRLCADFVSFSDKSKTAAQPSMER